MLLLLFGVGEEPGPDLTEPISTPPAPGTGVVTQFPATSGEWRLSLEIAEPPGTTWYDITQFYVGDRHKFGADDYKGKARARLVEVQLQIDSVQAADLEVSADILAPWGQDTTDLFGENVELGEGLLMRLSLINEVDDVVVEWLPIWTGRVEVWGDASAARGQVRTHVVSVVDTMADLTNVPVTIPDSVDFWPEWFTDVVLPAAGWPFGVDIYGDLTSASLPTDENYLAAINRMDQGTDPLGLVWRTLRSGRMVIHPAPWDTTNTNRYENPLLDAYPEGLKFSYAPDFTDIEYIADDDQQPFGIPRSTAGILNSFVVTMPADEIYAVDDPISTGKKGIRPFTATWILSNPPVVDDLLADRAFSSSQALPLRTTIDHEGFWKAMALVDHLDPVTVIHATSDDGLVVTGTGTIRNVVEERTVRGPGLLNWQSTVQIDIDSTETSEPLLPVENLALVSTSSSLLGGDSTATFSWTNPTQPSITPTEVQYRVIGRSLIWLPKSYPGVGSDGLLIGSLDPATQYTFQVRLIRRVDGVVTNFSATRQVVFTTPARIYPVPVPDGDDTDADIPGDPDGDGDCDLTVELQENDGTGWSTVDTFTDSELTDNGDGTYSLTTPIPNSFFNEGSMYRFRSSCDGVTWFTGPEFDPPDDWTDPCTEPPALSDPPYDDAELLVYVPKVCTGAEDGDPDFVFQGMEIIEAVSGIVGAHGPALDEIQSLIGDPETKSLLAIADPDWTDAGAYGIVAFGECPQITGETGSKTLGVKVNVTQAESCVLFECAGMQITCTPDGSGWAAGATVYSVDGTIALLSDELNLGTTYEVSVTFDATTGEVLLYVDSIEVSDDTFGAATTTLNVLPIWRVGAPPESWITDCAVWSRVLTPGEVPGPIGLLNAVHWWDFSNAGSRTDVGINVTAITDLINGAVMAVNGGTDVEKVTTVGGNGLTAGQCSPAGGASARMTTSGLLLTTQPIWVSWVGRFPGSPSAGGVAFYLANTGSPPHFFNDTSTWQMRAGATLDGGTQNTSTHIFYCEFNGGSSKFYIDNVLVASGSTSTGAANATATLFNVNGGGVGGTITIGEIVMGTGTNTGGDITNEYNRLVNKWV